MIRVGLNRMVTLRYRMKNSSGEIIANTLDRQPVTFLYGSGKILHGLEQALEGLKIGQQKSFKISEEDTPGLRGTFQFDIVIDDISWADDSSSLRASPCGPDCLC